MGGSRGHLTAEAAGSGKFRLGTFFDCSVADAHSLIALPSPTACALSGARRTARSFRFMLTKLPSSDADFVGNNPEVDLTKALFEGFF